MYHRYSRWLVHQQGLQTNLLQIKGKKAAAGLLSEDPQTVTVPYQIPNRSQTYRV